MTQTDFVALVPMKGHSERVPNKNLRSMCGKPLCFWILETLSEVAAVSTIVVNTDSDEIAAKVERNFDVVIHRRPQELCGDFVSMNRIIAYDLDQLADRRWFLQTHATNPLLSAPTVRHALDVFEKNLPQHDSLFSVNRLQERFYDVNGKPINHDPSTLERTQDLEPIFVENSNLYVFSRDSFRARNHRIGAHPKLFEMDELEATDIDEKSDWTLAEALLGEFGVTPSLRNQT
jgi:CMP-N-acetylneuraminic acid synthetase